MRLMDILRRTQSWSSEESRQWLERQPVDSYTLLDVREPAEYEGGHLPGALLIPLSQLPDRLAEVPPDKPVLVY